MYNNKANGHTQIKNGGNFNVQSGGTVNTPGKHTTWAGGTTTTSGEWNEQGTRNTIYGIFNVATNGMYDNEANGFTLIRDGGIFNVQSGGVYDNEVNGLTKIKSGANFNLQNGGKVNNFGKYVVLPGGTVTLDDAYDNNVGSKTTNFGTINQDCNGMFNDLGGIFGGTPIVDICS